jgi:hypothetical protein
MEKHILEFLDAKLLMLLLEEKNKRGILSLREEKKKKLPSRLHFFVP